MHCSAVASAITGEPIREDETGGTRARNQHVPLQNLCRRHFGAMTSLAGVFFAFYYNNLFPEQVFHISRSIELILGRHRGHRRCSGRSRRLSASPAWQKGCASSSARCFDVPGATQVFYGVCCSQSLCCCPRNLAADCAPAAAELRASQTVT